MTFDEQPSHNRNTNLDFNDRNHPLLARDLENPPGAGSTPFASDDVVRFPESVSRILSDCRENGLPPSSHWKPMGML